MSDRRASRLMWFGVWAAPAAWALQHAAGVMFGLAQCNPNGARWQIALRTWDVAIAALAADVIFLTMIVLYAVGTLVDVPCRQA